MTTSVKNVKNERVFPSTQEEIKIKWIKCNKAGHFSGSFLLLGLYTP